MKQFKIIPTAADTSIIIYKDSSQPETNRFTVVFVNTDGTSKQLYDTGYPLAYAYKLAAQAAKVVNKRLTAAQAL